jgi:hypothetical protein
VGDGEAVGDFDATADLDADGCADADGETPEGVPGDVTVSTAGVMSAGTAPGKTVGDEDDLDGAGATRADDA